MFSGPKNEVENLEPIQLHKVSHSTFQKYLGENKYCLGNGQKIGQ
jgi:hypothetical protein